MGTVKIQKMKIWPKIFLVKIGQRVMQIVGIVH